MLYALGSLTFTVAPFNASEIERVSAMDFAKKELLGRRRGHERVGEGEEQITLHGSIFPETLGGLDGLALLDSMRAQGVPQMLIRGDGTPLGWFLIERVRETGRHLNAQGVAKQIEFTVELTRDDKPSPENFLASLFSLLG